MKLLWQNGEDEKRDTNSSVAGRRKQTKERVAEQLCMHNIPVGLSESDDSSESNSTELRVSANIAVKFL